MASNISISINKFINDLKGIVASTIFIFIILMNRL